MPGGEIELGLGGVMRMGRELKLVENGMIGKGGEEGESSFPLAAARPPNLDRWIVEP